MLVSSQLFCIKVMIMMHTHMRAVVPQHTVDISYKTASLVAFTPAQHLITLTNTLITFQHPRRKHAAPNHPPMPCSPHLRLRQHSRLEYVSPSIISTQDPIPLNPSADLCNSPRQTGAQICHTDCPPGTAPGSANYNFCIGNCGCFLGAAGC